METLPHPVKSRHLGPLGLYYNQFGWELRWMLPRLHELMLLQHWHRKP